MGAGTKPTILQVIPALRAGGAEQSAIDVSRAVADAGWRAMIASAGGRLSADLAASGIEHVTLPLDTKNPAALVTNAFRLRSLIRREGVDIVHARSRGPAWSALWASLWCGVPFVTTYHGAYGQKNAVKAFYNSVMARGAVTIANSHWTARLVAERHGERASRIVTIPRGVDLGRFDPDGVDGSLVEQQRAEWGLGRDDFVVLHLARLSRLKGQTTVVDALAMLKESHPDLRVVFAGEATMGGDYEERLLARIASEGLAERCILPGYCERPDLAVAAADVVLSASQEPETFGRVAVEAGAMERPAIVTAIGATAETVLFPPQVADQDRTGWAVPPGDPLALARALEEVASLTHSQRQSLGQRARRHVEAHFTLETMGEANLAVYRELLEKR